VSKVKIAVLSALGPPGGAAARPSAQETVIVSPSAKPTEVFTGCELKVLTGQAAGRSFPLSKAEVVVGRGDEADVQLPDATVSRKHVVLTLESGNFVLTNESQAGTTVNGHSVTRHELNNGDEIQMGEVKVQFAKLR